MDRNYKMVDGFNRTMEWIDQNSIKMGKGEGIAVFSGVNKTYPEVTGYFIPTLLQWGERDRAVKYATYLCSIQKDDGSWYDSDDKEPYVFDSAQILKGLLSIREIMPSVDEKIVKGCEWILSNMHEDGRLTTPNKDAWGNDESFCSELVHIYCLSPIKEAGVIFDRPDFIEKANKILAYYKVNKEKEILNFSLLSHFYAYVMEGLFDMGEIEMCKEAMNRLEKHQNRKGGIPGLKDVPWVCSTGLFQIALVWYKLGELEKGNRIFEYAVSLQNSSGGWYGSYPAPTLLSKFYIRRWKPYYFPKSEISWACKYYLDALALREKLEFKTRV